MEVVRQIKEEVSYVAYDPKKQEEEFSEAGSLVSVGVVSLILSLLPFPLELSPSLTCGMGTV